MTKQIDLEETAGDTFSRNLQFTDGDGEAKDITGWEVHVTVKETYDSSTNTLNTTVTNHDDASGGATSFSFPPEDTADLNGSYKYDVKYKDDGGEVDTIIRGRVNFKPSATGDV